MTDQNPGTRVLVFGAGAVGSLLGGMLANAGCEVTLLGRSEARRIVQQQGLKVETPDRHFAVKPHFIESIDELTQPPDVILLTTRAFAVSDAIPRLKEALNANAILVTIQNGIGTEELIARNLPGTQHVAGSLTLSANWVAPGHVESTSRSGGIALAPVSGNTDAQWVAKMFADAGVVATTVEDYRSVKWSKLLLNMMGNAVPAILDWTAGDVYRDPDTFQIERATILEAVEVIRAEGTTLVSLPGFPVPMVPWIFRLPAPLSRRILLSRVQGGRGDKPPSLLLDLQAGRQQTEARWLYGAIVEAGANTGVDTPVNRRLLRVIEGVATNTELREAFRNQPDRLVRNVFIQT